MRRYQRGLHRQISKSKAIDNTSLDSLKKKNADLLRTCLEQKHNPHIAQIHPTKGYRAISKFRVLFSQMSPAERYEKFFVNTIKRAQAHARY